MFFSLKNCLIIYFISYNSLIFKTVLSLISLNCKKISVTKINQKYVLFIYSLVTKLYIQCLHIHFSNFYLLVYFRILPMTNHNDYTLMDYFISLNMYDVYKLPFKCNKVIAI